MIININTRQFLHNANYAVRNSNYEVAPYIAITDLYESKKLNLQIEKAKLNLNWSPKWSFEIAINKTINWYKKVLKNPNLAKDLCIEDINDYQNLSAYINNITCRPSFSS